MADFTPNAKQQECIDNIDGKYLVLAGPGTGKTFTIIERIKSMVLKGIKPERILALTFSDAAANEMKNRLDKELGKLDSGVYISTYHSFCLDIIKNNTEEFELPDNYKIITDTIKNKFIKECIDYIHPKAYRTEKNDPYYYLSTILKQIEDIKMQRLSKDDFFENIRTNPDWEPELKNAQEKLEQYKQDNKKIPAYVLTDIDKAQKKLDKAYELWQFYELYKSKTEAEHYIDFIDMINFVLDKFDYDETFLKEIANNYDYLLVDEYQDTNKSQNEIIIKLAQNMNSGNVFVVGDDDQIIFTFQGAKLDTMEKFLEKFPQTKVICLTENMRSTQSILDFARQAAIQDNNRLEANPLFEKYNICKELKAKNKDITKFEKPVRLYKYQDIMQEYSHIAEEIDNLVNSNECPKDDNGNKLLSEIAILTLSNAELDTFAQMLKERNIPYELKDGKNIFLIKSSLVMYYYMQMLTSPELHSDKIFKLLLLPPFNINSKDYETLYQQRAKYKTFIDAMKLIDKTEFIEPEKIINFTLTYDYLQSYRTNETLKNVVLEIGSKTGIFDYFINSEINRNENIAGIKKITDEAENYSQTMKSISLDDFVEYLDMVYNGETTIKTDKAPVTLNAVQLATYHSSKGREFSYVYMPTLLREKWESSSKSYKSAIPLPAEEYKSKDELADIKYSDNIKLLFVGITRAKHSLHLSYPKSVAGKDKQLSKFILQIQDHTEQKEAPEFDENSYWNERTKDLIKRDYDYNKEFHSIVDAQLKNKAYSPTSVNIYLKCPRQYFYNYILDLAAKDGNADALYYGTAIHEACEKAVKFAMKNRNYPEKTQFIKYFTDKLSNLPVSNFETMEILKVRGQNALDKYYVQMCNTPINELYEVEKYLEFPIDDVKFCGIVDRIDKNSDGTYSIYDYKTGNAKNSASISIGGEHEDYYNQIALYKYFFEQKEKCTVKSTGFIFPEEFEKNLEIDFTETECQAVVDKFKSAIQNIKEHKFEPIAAKNRTKSKICEYCQYKDFCSLEVI